MPFSVVPIIHIEGCRLDRPHPSSSTDTLHPLVRSSVSASLLRCTERYGNQSAVFMCEKLKIKSCKVPPEPNPPDTLPTRAPPAAPRRKMRVPASPISGRGCVRTCGALYLGSACPCAARAAGVRAAAASTGCMRTDERCARHGGLLADGHEATMIALSLRCRTSTSSSKRRKRLTSRASTRV